MASKAVLAKSDGTSLLEHIEESLAILSQLREALPCFNDINLDNSTPMGFWEMLFIAVYFHDFGKTHLEFQKYLQNGDHNWQSQRHEFYSVPFVDKIDTSQNVLLSIKYAILGHHKYFKDLHQYHTNRVNYQKEITTKIDANCVQCLLNILPNLYSQFFHTPLVLKQIDISDIRHPYVEYIKPIIRGEETQTTSTFTDLLLWGALKICDHYSSAGIKKLLMLEKKDFHFLAKIPSLYHHQSESQKRLHSTILCAPTGSGKTESALLWLENQIALSQGRTFYVLPFTASINAMYQRLAKHFSEKVGLSHSKLNHFLASMYDNEAQEAEKTKWVKNQKDRYKKMLTPLKIITPFQILKHLFSVKNFEMGMVELVGCKVIFDEIHAYNIKTFAQIVVLIEFLRQRFRAKCFIMTATLPTFIKEMLANSCEMSKQDVITADDKFMARFMRHNLKMIDGQIADHIKSMQQMLSAGKKVLIVCNTVAEAQNVFTTFKDYDICKCLLHSRFIYKDRQAKEQLLTNEKCQLLIGTQAIEVSLDIDFDVLYSQPAPLDAIIQRMGRINRKGKKDVSEPNVFIFDTPGENDHFIYPEKVVRKSIEVLKENQGLISENKLQEMIDSVYPNWDEQEMKYFNDTKYYFQKIIEKLKPFERDIMTEEEFEKQFDNVQVLPMQFIDHWTEYIADSDYINAEQLLLSIPKSAFYAYKANGQISREKTFNKAGKDEQVWTVKNDYDSELGLAKSNMFSDAAMKII